MIWLFIYCSIYTKIALLSICIYIHNINSRQYSQFSYINLPPTNLGYAPAVAMCTRFSSGLAHLVLTLLAKLLSFTLKGLLRLHVPVSSLLVVDGGSKLHLDCKGTLSYSECNAHLCFVALATCRTTFPGTFITTRSWPMGILIFGCVVAIIIEALSF